jgi:hypothetical protein
MIARNVESRILKLEAQRKHPDEILVIWRSPGQEVADVIAGTAFVRGDRVICSEWFGEGEPPLPKWRQACHMRDFDPTEQDSIYRCLDRLVEARRDCGSAANPSRPAPYLAHMSDIDLLHAALGVET